MYKLPFVRRLACCALLALPILAAAQSYPERPVKLVVPYAPGGSADIAARLIADDWGKALGQPIVIENRSGAGGNIGVDIVSKAKNDGYTIGLQTVSLAINPSLYDNMPYDTLKDLAPIGMVATSQHVLVVNNDLKARSVAELIAAAKAAPGQLLYGSAGSGSTFHMAAELFKSVSKTDIMHIPYRGGGPAMLDTIGGHVQMSFPVLSAALPQVQGGKLRALGVTGPKRSALMPDVPTIGEAGLPGYSFETWFMVFAPAGTPAPVLEKLNATLNQTLDSPALKERMTREGYDPAPSSIEQARKLLAGDMKKWNTVISAAGIKAN
ncbi:tripartite tricarboxylate transporter substrate binding protein [Parapusillimonas granuli]|uniref:Tripartite tricarboxylate transporter substrate binding protein n=1 Tax=Parapusillimonas granuli TaxID=380911 RepID=A0A853FUH4_9BURK|nr:tripartite tricarboxylate transporter substrate binding protein [Parapusillimonas granuli]MBB5216158.1 tripartite-type tricarboxylate transporter receptor subunit TctC [Parapusillimonas granuli]MEB2400433.1 tripartite tricarboxylate transporter substrate binding protein [Alcaligenaceae bacterium]NYT47837.1 tripartite tricarboxylate transporter substrate binding protein [Parapusillimonas granuli]